MHVWTSMGHREMHDGPDSSGPLSRFTKLLNLLFNYHQVLDEACIHYL